MVKGDYDAVVEAVDTALELSPDKSRQYLARVADNLTEKVSQDQALAIIQKLRLYQDNDVEALFTYARFRHFSNIMLMLCQWLKWWSNSNLIVKMRRF